MKTPVGDWQKSLAHRIGMAGSIEYLSTPHGQTLHIPCTYGDHIVDVRVANRQHPDAVVKRMLNMGWTIGSKPKFPDCNRRISLKRKVAGAKRWEGVPTEERRAQMAALQVKSVEKRVKKDETIMPNEAEKVGDLVLSGSNVAAATPAMSAAAKKSHRLVMQALEDYYDEAKSTYREGWTDKKVASERRFGSQRCQCSRGIFRAARRAFRIDRDQGRPGTC